MTRFLAIVAVAVVAGAMYVAAAPGGQRSTPTAKQFAALKKQVVKLQKQVKAAQSDVNSVAAVMVECLLHQTVPVVQKGDTGGTYGFSYTDNLSNPSLTTALDLTSGTPTYTLLTLNTDTTLGCTSLVGAGGASHVAGLKRFAAHH